MYASVLPWHNQTLLPSPLSFSPPTHHLPCFTRPPRLPTISNNKLIQIALSNCTAHCPLLVPSQPQNLPGCRQLDSEDTDNNNYTFGTVLVAILLQSAMAARALAEEQTVSESAETASRVPGWLGPAVLAVPIASYFLFSLYRDKVNPYARVTDWMFGMVALVIIANLLLMFTIGVRLY